MKDDFNPDELAMVREHHRDIGDLSAKVTALEERFGDNSKHARSFVDLCENEKQVDEAVTKILLNLVTTNPIVNAAIGAEVRKIDRGTLRYMGGKVGFAIWTFVVILATAGVEHFVK